jgi:hypothetical protein
MFCNQQQRLYRGLPFVGVVLCLGKFGDAASRSVTSGFRPGTVIGSKNR